VLFPLSFISRVLAGRRVLDLECAARLTCRVRYQVAGARLSSAEALAAPDRLATLRTDLEAALGPLVVFDVMASEMPGGCAP
jgi:hypothetical protein